MAEYPTNEQLRDPNFIMPMEFAAPQDRGEPAPQANPAPGPGVETEPRTDLKEFVETPGDNLGADHVSAPKRVKAPASKAGGTEAQTKK